LARVRHAGEPQAGAEEQARAERGEHQDHDATPSRWRVTTATATPVAMKSATATSERSESRPRPHTPWPLVQPPPMRVPKPTRKPEATTQPRPSAREGAGPANACQAKPARIRPAMNAMRHARSPAGALVPASKPCRI